MFKKAQKMDLSTSLDSPKNFTADLDSSYEVSESVLLDKIKAQTDSLRYNLDAAVKSRKFISDTLTTYSIFKTLLSGVDALILGFKETWILQEQFDAEMYTKDLEYGNEIAELTKKCEKMEATNQDLAK